MARCVCIRCMGKGECFLRVAGTVNRCPLCLGLGILGGVDGDCAAAVARVFPAHYTPDEEEDAEVETAAPPGVFLYEAPEARLTRRPTSQETKSCEQRLAALEMKYDRLLARVETLEAHGARFGPPKRFGGPQG